MDKKRIIWIDVVKGTAMLFIMLHHHIMIVDQSVYRLFYSPFFLTAFFVTAGYVFRGNEVFFVFLNKKVRTLLIPLFLLAIIGILTQRNLRIASLCSQIKDLIIQEGTGGYRMWFVAAMFVACMAFYFIVRLKDVQVLLTCSVLAVINIIWRQYYPETLLPWHIEMMGVACFWMGFGYFLRKGLDRSGTDFITLKVQALAFGGYILLLFCAYRFFGITYLSLLEYQSHAVAYFVLNGAGVVWICLFANNKFPALFEKILVFIGQNTLFYFAFHGKLQSVMMVLLTKLNLMEMIIRFQYILFPLLVFMEAILLIIPCIIFSKMIPIAVGKKRE